MRSAIARLGVACTVLFGSVLLCTCGDSTTPPAALAPRDAAALPVAQAMSAVRYPLVAITPSTTTLAVGKVQKFTARLNNATGAPWTSCCSTWTSSNPSVLSVTMPDYGKAGADTAFVTGVAAGTATLTAETQSKTTGSLTITVGGSSTTPPAPVASVTVSPASSALTIGHTVQLAATMKDASGNVLSGRPVTWASSNSSMATVSSTGLVTAVAAGSATTTATSGGQSGAASVSVSAAAPAAPAVPVSGQGAPWTSASVGDVLSWHWETATSMGPFTDPTFQGAGEIVANPLGPGYCWRRDIAASTSDVSYELNAEFASRQSAWVRFWYYQPLGDPQNDYVSGSNIAIMKMVRFREQGFGNEYGTFNIQWSSYLFFGLNDVNTLSNVGSIPTPNQNRGAWHEFLVHYDISNPGTEVLQIWIDKVKYFDTAIAGTLPSSDGFGIIMIGGDVNGPHPASTDYIGAIDVYSSQPGDL